MVKLTCSTFASVALLVAGLSTTRAVDVTVNLDYATYVGTAQGSTGVSQWLGVRYAAPPVGELRFQPPQDPPKTTSPQPADAHGKVCLGTGELSSETKTAEDCLFLDVYAPTNATTDSKLPVYFFIQGGGFNKDSKPNLNGTGLINASGNNIVVVGFNYRVGPYGFLTDGENITPNIGLLDQRKALHWVQKYIAQFGGDPKHVVLGGDSAGAASVSLHLVANGGRDDGLFHAAAAESVVFSNMLTVDEARYQFDNLAIRLGCVRNTSSAVLDCLRSKTAVEIQDVNENIPFPGSADPPIYMYGPLVDGDLLRDLTYTEFKRGHFIRVPIITGDDTNGGTVFTPRDATTFEETNLHLRNQFPQLTLAHLAEIERLYPNPNQTACPALGCFWRQAANVYGEMRFMCPGLFVSSAFTQRGVPQSWAYRWDVEDPEQIAEGLGVPHTVEFNAIWGPENTNGRAPASYYANGTNANAVKVIQGYWTSFIRTFDPNVHRVPGSAEWVPWNDTAKGRLLFSTGGGTAMENLAGSDLMTRCEFWSNIGEEIRQRR